MANYGPFYQQGVYVVEVVGQALGKAMTGTPQFILRFKVLGTPVPDSDSFDSVSQQYERTLYMALTEKTAPYVKENLEKLGFNGGSITILDPGHAQHQSFVGNQIDMYCKHEADQNGNVREKWQISRGAGGIKADPLDQREMRQLDALFGKNASKPTLHIRPHVETGAEITDDDIPF